MLVKTYHANSLGIPVAILDKELLHTNSFRTELFEFCSLCGARFGIGFFSPPAHKHLDEEVEDLPRKLTEILAKDHRQRREHKGYIELDF